MKKSTGIIIGTVATMATAVVGITWKKLDEIDTTLWKSISDAHDRDIELKINQAELAISVMEAKNEIEKIKAAVTEKYQ